MKLSTREQLRQEAISLLGRHLIRDIGDTQLVGKIVEVELYSDDDPASHSYNGKTERNASMFLPRNHAYVYFTYGMHYCLNVSVGVKGQGAAVLIRALEPLEGVDTMRDNRLKYTRNCSKSEVANGPAKLTQALAITQQIDGHSLQEPPLRISGEGVGHDEVTASKRIGISKAQDELLRFYIHGNNFVSKH